VLSALVNQQTSRHVRARYSPLSLRQRFHPTATEAPSNVRFGSLADPEILSMSASHPIADGERTRKKACGPPRNGCGVSIVFAIAIPSIHCINPGDG
jgi:hypothetical protein